MSQTSAAAPSANVQLTAAEEQEIEERYRGLDFENTSKRYELILTDRPPLTEAQYDDAYAALTIVANMNAKMTGSQRAKLSRQSILDGLLRSQVAKQQVTEIKTFTKSRLQQGGAYYDRQLWESIFEASWQKSKQVQPPQGIKLTLVDRSIIGVVKMLAYFVARRNQPVLEFLTSDMNVADFNEHSAENLTLQQFESLVSIVVQLAPLWAEHRRFYSELEVADGDMKEELYDFMSQLHSELVTDQLVAEWLQFGLDLINQDKVDELRAQIDAGQNGDSPITAKQTVLQLLITSRIDVSQLSEARKRHLATPNQTERDVARPRIYSPVTRDSHTASANHQSSSSSSSSNAIMADQSSSANAIASNQAAKNTKEHAKYTQRPAEGKVGSIEFTNAFTFEVFRKTQSDLLTRIADDEQARARFREVVEIANQVGKYLYLSVEDQFKVLNITNVRSKFLDFFKYAFINNFTQKQYENAVKQIDDAKSSSETLAEFTKKFYVSNSTLGSGIFSNPNNTFASVQHYYLLYVESIKNDVVGSIPDKFAQGGVEEMTEDEDDQKQEERVISDSTDSEKAPSSDNSRSPSPSTDLAEEVRLIEKAYAAASPGTPEQLKFARQLEAADNIVLQTKPKRIKANSNSEEPDKFDDLFGIPVKNWGQFRRQLGLSDLSLTSKTSKYTNAKDRTKYGWIKTFLAGMKGVIRQTVGAEDFPANAAESADEFYKTLFLGIRDSKISKDKFEALTQIYGLGTDLKFVNRAQAWMEKEYGEQWDFKKEFPEKKEDKSIDWIITYLLVRRVLVRRTNKVKSQLKTNAKNRKVPAPGNVARKSGQKRKILKIAQNHDNSSDSAPARSRQKTISHRNDFLTLPESEDSSDESPEERDQPRKRAVVREYSSQESESDQEQEQVEQDKTLGDNMQEAAIKTFSSGFMNNSKQFFFELLAVMKGLGDNEQMRSLNEEYALQQSVELLNKLRFDDTFNIFKLKTGVGGKTKARYEGKKSYTKTFWTLHANLWTRDQVKQYLLYLIFRTFGSDTDTIKNNYENIKAILTSELENISSWQLILDDGAAEKAMEDKTEQIITRLSALLTLPPLELSGQQSRLARGSSTKRRVSFRPDVWPVDHTTHETSIRRSRLSSHTADMFSSTHASSSSQQSGRHQQRMAHAYEHRQHNKKRTGSPMAKRRPLSPVARAIRDAVAEYDNVDAYDASEVIDMWQHVAESKNNEEKLKFCVAMMHKLGFDINKTRVLLDFFEGLDLESDESVDQAPDLYSDWYDAMYNDLPSSDLMQNSDDESTTDDDDDEENSIMINGEKWVEEPMSGADISAHYSQRRGHNGQYEARHYGHEHGKSAMMLRGQGSGMHHQQRNGEMGAMMARLSRLRLRQ